MAKRFQVRFAPNAGRAGEFRVVDTTTKRIVVHLPGPGKGPVSLANWREEAHSTARRMNAAIPYPWSR